MADSSLRRTCGGETATFHCLRGRKGDQLWVRHNLRALGYVALIGSGMTVLDSDRYYNLPTRAGPERGGGRSPHSEI